MSTPHLCVTKPATPASAMMTVTAMLKTSVTMMESVSSMCAWQIQSVMDMIRFAMLSMTTASTVERMIVLPIQMAAVQVISPFLQPINKYKLF